MKIALWCVVVMICSICLWEAIERDLHLVKMFPQDLRNRVVGARLQKDGIDPYFYTWKRQDGIRYYDPNSFNANGVSNITASPFFHQLLYPVADMPQYKIRILWLCIQYCILLLMAILCFSLANAIGNRLIVIVFSTAFLFTEAWKNMVVSGQLYLIIPFLFFLSFYFLRKSNNPFFAFIYGLIFIAAVMIRPNIIIAFLPFIFAIKQFTVRAVVFFLLPVVVMILLVFGSNTERNLWVSYRNSIKAHIQLHTGETKDTLQDQSEKPTFAYWEGMDETDMEREKKEQAFTDHSEHGNVFVLAKLLFGVKLSPGILLFLSILVLLACFVILYYRAGTTRLDLINLALYGYCMYMISDLFSPIYRYQYYTVQWLLPLLLSALMFSRRNLAIYIFICVGLILNMVNIAVIPMEHTMGEYIWLASFMLLGFFISGGNFKKIKSRAFINGK